MTQPDIPTKRCFRCREEFPRTAEYFIRHAQNRDGLSSYCKPCHSAIRREAACLRRQTLQPFTAFTPDPRLSCAIRRLRYGDALLCGEDALERQQCGRSYVEYLLYRAGVLLGVVEVRAEDCTTIYRLQDRLAHYLLTECRWTMENVRRIDYGARTSPQLSMSGVPRLLKASADRQSA